MPWPVIDAWDQHLDELNAKNFSRAFKVSVVRIENPFKHSCVHTRHVHPYWQMAVVMQKSFSVEFDGARLEPESGELMIIPPQNWHFFDFSQGKSAWTVKFTVESIEERFPPQLISRSPDSDIIFQALMSLFENGRQNSDSGMLLLEHLIESLIDLQFFGKDLVGTEAQLVQKSRQFIEQKLFNGNQVTAGETAAHLKVHPVYLCRVFKKQLGIPLKTFIDQLRFDMAKRLLVYSDLNISGVSEEMGFSDVFRFSRFFKRMSGLSPVNYIKEQKKPDTA